jgi:hypothetical protein
MLLLLKWRETAKEQLSANHLGGGQTGAIEPLPFPSPLPIDSSSATTVPVVGVPAETDLPWLTAKPDRQFSRGAARDGIWLT